MTPFQILLIEDEDADFRFTQKLLEFSQSEGGEGAPTEFVLERANSLRAGCQVLGDCHFDIILLDLSLPDSDGLNGLNAIRELVPMVPIVMLTGFESEDTALQALNHGAQDYLTKGNLTHHKLVRSIRYALERQRILSRVEECEREALAATEAKSLFLANMSHEMRTPLTSIIGFGELLASRRIHGSQNQQYALQTIVRNGQHLLKIINEILDLAKIEAGKMTVERAPIDLFQLMRDVDLFTKFRALEKGLDCGIEYRFPLPKVIESDSTRLKQVLVNLIGNAIKFTDRGSVIVHVFYLSGEDRVGFEIEDTGIGISREQLVKVFDSFEQGDPSITRQYGGTGLGLTLSKRLAEMLGGDLEFKSEVGRGTVVRFSIARGSGALHEVPMISELPPALSVAETNRIGALVPRLAGKVLLVEDAVDTQNLLRYLIFQTGASVTICNNGKEAVEVALKENFDLIFMDMQMPVMDGYTATAHLRQSGYQSPIIALTASTHQLSKEKFQKAGCDGALIKPCTELQLYDTLRKYLKVIALVEDDAIEPAPHSEAEDNSDVEIIERFRQGLPNKIAEIEQACREARWSELEQRAHRLAVADMFGFAEISAIARALQTSARNREEQESRQHVGALKMLEGYLEVQANAEPQW